jgi:prolyl-tRNA editing enzyme YbaK/EbsC (Cys-tRNA(Pro) deacylase)
MADEPASLSPSAQRVQDALESFHVRCQVVELPGSTRTADDAAQAVGCNVGAIVKSLVFRGGESGRPVLILTSGANRVQERKMAAYVGERIVRADPDFVRERTGFAIGGVPPIGHLVPPVTLIDEDLMGYDQIWAAAGTPHAVFCVSPADLVAITGGQVVPVK